VLFYNPRFLDHVASPYHVERPDRLRAIVDRLRSEKLFEDVREPKAARLADVHRVHRKPFLDSFRSMGEGFLDPETAVHPGTWEVALLAAGTVLGAARAAVAEAAFAVALVRPPGHHAGPDHGGGFCYLNNVAIAAAEQVSRGSRVAILDYDAHHGNGTAEIFASEPRVLYVSTHQYGIYPGTGPAADVGEGEGRGFTVNVPFGPACGDSSYVAAREAIIEPLVSEFAPDLILMSLGVDAHYRDPLTSLALSSPGYVDLVLQAADLARRLCSGRFVVALEGGYHLLALSEVVAGVVAGLRNTSVALELSEIVDRDVRGRDAIEATRRAQEPFWNLR
jgi:acetoin utilization deacetylase AcuC-like enzyme